jgi:hypothetical protein
MKMNLGGSLLVDSPGAWSAAHRSFPQLSTINLSGGFAA